MYYFDITTLYTLMLAAGFDRTLGYLHIPSLHSNTSGVFACCGPAVWALPY